jgi:hypothetical protein
VRSCIRQVRHLHQSRCAPGERGVVDRGSRQVVEGEDRDMSRSSRRVEDEPRVEDWNGKHVHLVRKTGSNPAADLGEW